MPAMKRGCALPLAALAGIGLIALIAGGAAFQWVNEQPWFCNSCHEMEFHYQSWEASTHAETAECLDCHASPGLAGFIEEKARGAEQLVAHFTGDYPIPIQILVRVRNEQCLACHSDAAALPDRTIDARHAVHLASQVACVECHSRLVHNYPEQAKVLPLDQCDSCHQKHTSFPMIGTHATLTCTACHVGGVYQGTDPRCEACHSVPAGHLEPFKTDCGICHAASGWKPARTDHSAFVLVGKHAEASCMGCHAGERFEGTPSTCESCHQVPTEHIPGITSGCGECHTPSGWRPANFDHSFFALQGKHETLACAQCHPAGRYAGTPKLCENCHATPPDHPVGKLGNCGVCHSPAGWVPATFNHNRFPLTGVHGTLACTACHASGVFQGLASSCSACHGAPSNHAGLSSNCAGCHSTSRFSPSTFRHPRVGEHIPSGEHRLSCRDCHQSSFGQASCTKCHSSNNPGDGGDDD
jgi:nitrate/TMAO reductase-like tetraheme cytochrome c subunit